MDDHIMHEQFDMHACIISLDQSKSAGVRIIPALLFLMRMRFVQNKQDNGNQFTKVDSIFFGVLSLERV